jgi:uncharacterized protein YbjT (DUF2867 family)
MSEHMSQRADQESSGLILLTGATGYVGGRLLPQLLQHGRRVRCLARRPEYLRARVGSDADVVAGDLLDRESLRPALAAVRTAYYLAHSLGTGPDFEAREMQCATNFAAVAAEAGVARIVYLGGLGDSAGELSAHLRSRQEVGRLLHATGVPLIELRASIVLGSGSLSFEMIRALVERLPVMITPRWVAVEAQPIAIADLLGYLEQALDLPGGEGHRIYEIGGADRMTYADLMREYARQRGFKRLMIPVPVLTPGLSSLWLGLVTPLFAPVGRVLVESIKNPTVVHDERALQDFDLQPVGVEAAIAAALRNEDRDFAETRWSDATSAIATRRRWGGVHVGNRIVDSRTREVKLTARQAFAPIRRIGGSTGWYFGNWLWQLRGLLDLLVAGVGMRRGRRDPEWLSAGDVLDCWRVEAVEPDRRLRLTAEMRLPGRAWLEFEVEENGATTTIRQTAEYDPAGLTGLLYWYVLYPVHAVLFRGMLRGIAKSAERGSAHV